MAGRQITGIAKLRARFGRKIAVRAAIERLIREDVPGGELVLQRVKDWWKICNRRGWGDRNAPEPIHVTAYRHFVEILEVIEDSLRAEYDLARVPRRDEPQRRQGSR